MSKTITKRKGLTKTQKTALATLEEFIKVFKGLNEELRKLK